MNNPPTSPLAAGYGRHPWPDVGWHLYGDRSRAAEGMPPFWLAAGADRVCRPVMSAIWALRGCPVRQHRPHGPNARLIIGALSSAVPFMLLAWGQQYVTSRLCRRVHGRCRLMVLPLAHFLVPGEQMTWRKTLGFVIGFVGVVLLIGAQAFESTGATLETAGRIACIRAACCYALSSILMRRLPAVDTIGLATCCC